MEAICNVNSRSGAEGEAKATRGQEKGNTVVNEERHPRGERRVLALDWSQVQGGGNRQ